MSLFSFLRKYGETEDPLFRALPVEMHPIPDEGDVGNTPHEGEQYLTNVPEEDLNG